MITIKIFDDYGLSVCDAAYHEDEIFCIAGYMEGNELESTVNIIKELFKFQHAAQWPKTTGMEGFD